jgi:glyoxylase-like metal-dependent hydrolase (beta-lactamase superfamily II)
MMKRYLMTLVLAAAAINQTSCQDAGTWFSAKEVFPKVWQISDHGADNMYVIEGSDSSLLIDTGVGAADLASFVKKLTLKPMILQQQEATTLLKQGQERQAI